MSCESCCYAPCGRTTVCPPGTFYVVDPSDGTAVKTQRIVLPRDVETVVTRALVRFLEL